MRAIPLTFKRARVLRDLTLPEGILWRALKSKAVEGMRFRCQHPMGPYILDFYCPAVKLCVEVDGATHHSVEAAEHDERRTEWLGARGVRVLRFPAASIFDDRGLPHVSKPSRRRQPPPPPSAVPLPRCAGEELGRVSR